jgi:chromosomal replication initiation ATPase DnaA
MSNNLEQRAAEHRFSDAWVRVRAILRAELDGARFNQFIAPLSVVSAEPERVVLACPSPEARDRIVDRFGSRIADLLAQSLPTLNGVDFIADPNRPAVALVRPLERAETLAEAASTAAPAMVMAEAAPSIPGFGGGASSGGEPGSGAPIKIDRIKRKVAEHFSITVQDLESASRKRRLVWPRQLAMALARRLTPQTFPQIARRFGSRDHTTVMYGCQKVDKLSESDSAVAAKLALLTQAIRADDANKNTSDRRA